MTMALVGEVGVIRHDIDIDIYIKNIYNDIIQQF